MLFLKIFVISCKKWLAVAVTEREMEKGNTKENFWGSYPLAKCTIYVVHLEFGQFIWLCRLAIHFLRIYKVCPVFYTTIWVSTHSPGCSHWLSGCLDRMCRMCSETVSRCLECLPGYLDCLFAYKVSRFSYLDSYFGLWTV